MKFGGTMCVNRNCALKTICRRNEASGTTPNTHQSYAFFTPEKNGDCEYFYDVSEQQTNGDNT